MPAVVLMSRSDVADPSPSVVALEDTTIMSPELDAREL